jgi:anti-sigma factor RsiW
LGFEPWGLGGAAELVNARAIGEKQDTLMLAYRVNGTRVSLFQTRGDVNAGRLRKFGGDRLTSYRWSAHGSTFVLVGSLPEDQLKRLAGTLTPLK